MTRIKGLILVFLGAFAFLEIRNWLDRKMEKEHDMEIVRADLDAGDAHLGVWAQINANGWVKFRLKRDGRFLYQALSYQTNDTIQVEGRHDIIPAIEVNSIIRPRLLAVSNRGDTVIHHPLYLTRSFTRNLDILALACDTCRNGEVMFFYRVKQNDQSELSMDDLEKLQREDSIRREQLMPVRSKLSALELIELANCTSPGCVEVFMKEKTQDFVYVKKGEFVAKRRSAVPDSAGNQIIIPLSTLYMDAHPQASWKLAHTLHGKAQADSLLKEFEQLGFQFAEKRNYSGTSGKTYSYASKRYPGIGLQITATYNPWGFRGLYENRVTWTCYMFEVYLNNYSESYNQ